MRDIEGVNSGPSTLLRRDPTSVVLATLALGVLLRFILAASIGLGVDESYAVAVARQFSLSYFDHPPLHFWMVGAIAKLAQSEAGPVVRFPFALCFAGTTWLTFLLGKRFFGAQAGAVAAILLNVSAVFSLSTGGWVLPDGPLMLAMMASANVIAGLLFEEPSAAKSSASPTARWALAGLLAGLAMLSAKYHGVFVLAGTFAHFSSRARRTGDGSRSRDRISAPSSPSRASRPCGSGIASTDGHRSRSRARGPKGAVDSTWRPCSPTLPGKRHGCFRGSGCHWLQRSGVPSAVAPETRSAGSSPVSPAARLWPLHLWRFAVMSGSRIGRRPDTSFSFRRSAPRWRSDFLAATRERAVGSRGACGDLSRW